MIKSGECGKDELKVLEQIFTAEINHQLPAQFKSKYLAQLQARGYVEHTFVMLKGHPPCRVEGWVLTERGRLEYCRSCKDKEISTKNTHSKSHEKRAPRQRSGA